MQSRYYNPEWGRFINADSIIGTGDNLACYNLFAYCNNNPVMGYDPDGRWTWSWKDRAAFGAALLVAGIAILLAVPTGGASIAVGTIAISSTTAIATGGALAITGVIMIGDALIQADVSYAKKSRKSGKEKASDKPSWVSEKDVDLGKSSQRNASEMLNNKYGSGNWGKGPGSEFNQIVKWIDRSLRGIVLFVTDRFMGEEL